MNVDVRIIGEKVTEQGRGKIKKEGYECKVWETTDHIPTLSK